MIRRGLQLLLCIFFAIVVFLNIRLYGGTDPQDAIAQLHFLRQALDQGAGEQMQDLFPEGYFFMHALYASAWIEVGRISPEGSPRRQQARAEAKWALDQLESPAGRAHFPRDLEPPHGIFYAGWCTWLRGGLLSLYANHERPPEQWQRFTEQSVLIAEAFAKSDTPFLQSYAGCSWPVDSVVAAASLRLHDHLAAPRFGQVLARWRTQVQTRLDPTTGLVPHRVDSATGQPSASARGSSQALLLRFLLEVDPEMGRAHYLAFRSQFVASGWLLPGTREYPIGSDGRADVDSGPLVFGVSLSASVVSIAPARLVGDAQLAEPYLHLGEAMGVPFSWHGSRRYLGGQLPIGDAFLAYARTSTAWTEQPALVDTDRIVPWGWRLGWHLMSLGCFVLPFWLARKGKRAES